MTKTELAKEFISKRVMLLIVLLGLLVMKALGHNDTIDDMLLLVIGAISGKEILREVWNKWRLR